MRGALIAQEVPAGAGEGWSVGTAAAQRLRRLEVIGRRGCDAHVGRRGG